LLSVFTANVMFECSELLQYEEGDTERTREMIICIKGKYSLSSFGIQPVKKFDVNEFLDTAKCCYAFKNY